MDYKHFCTILYVMLNVTKNIYSINRMKKEVKKVAETKFVCDKLWRFFRCFRNEGESNHTIIDQNSVNSPCVL